MPTRPTPDDIDNAAAWLAYNDRVQAQGRAVLRVLFAVVLGVLLTLALVHFATPCATGALCWAPLAVPGRARAWLQSLHRRLRRRVLHARLQQLLGTAQCMALDPRPAGALRLGAVLARAASVRLELADLDRAERLHRRLHAANA